MQLQLALLGVAACGQVCVWATGILSTWPCITHALLGSPPAPREDSLDAGGSVKNEFVVVKNEFIMEAGVKSVAQHRSPDYFPVNIVLIFLFRCWHGAFY